MNRPTDAGRLPRPPLALVGRTGPERGSAPPPRPESDQVRPGRDAGRTPRRDTAPPGPGARQPDAERLVSEVRERTADLQRLKAEFDNYRRRVHRDRLAVGQIAVVNVLERLLPVLDAIAEAAEQGEVTGGFRRVADLLDAELASLGLVPFGTPGEPFDPNVHEAVTYRPTGAGARPAAGERPVCAEVLRRGFWVGDRLLRPAQVGVTGAPTTNSPKRKRH